MVDPAPMTGVANTFSATIRGTTNDDAIRSIDFQNGGGKVETSSGTVQGLLYSASDFAGYRVYVAIVPVADRWHILYPYCQGQRLDQLWHFDTKSSSLRKLEASGECVETTDASTALGVSLLGSTLTVPILCGFEVNATGVDRLAQSAPTGESITLNKNRVGTARLKDFTGALVEHQVIPFAGVNCSRCVGTSWYEVHSLLWNGTTREAAYGVVYLYGGQRGTFPDEGASLLLDNLFTMPKSARMSVVAFDGTWKASP